MAKNKVQEGIDWSIPWDDMTQLKKVEYCTLRGIGAVTFQETPWEVEHRNKVRERYENDRQRELTNA